MEIQLQEIIDKIKNEGVIVAEKNAATVKANAESEASSILADARKKANAIIENAKVEASKFEAAGIQSVSQASRDIILNLRTSIVSVLDSIVKRDTGAVLGSEKMAEIIAKLVATWAEKGSADYDILLPKKDIDAVRTHFLERLKNEFRKGIELRVDPRIEAGFRIAEKNGGAFYDFSDEGLASIISGFVNPAVKECVDRALDSRSGA